MRKCLRLATALLVPAISACTQNPPRPTPVDRASAQNPDGLSAENPRAREGGRAAGAGGSHAPGSTGLGSGTQGVAGTAAIGSGR